MGDDQIDLKLYKKLELIGKGSNGEVYRVQNISNNQYYAAKISLYPIRNDEDQLKSFKRELQFLQTLHNPAVIKFIGYSLTDFNGFECPVFITELMENSSLNKLLASIRKKKNIPKEWNNTKMIIIILGISLGMKFLHSAGITHRDLKPGNILLDSNLYPKLIDFGTARYLNTDNTEKTHFVGTPVYMAPEINEDDIDYTFKVDVFSFAMILYEIYANAPPTIRKGGAYGCINDILDGKRPDTKLLPNGPIKDLIEKCWSKSDIERPSFDEIVHIYKKERKALWPPGVDENEVEEYLNMFGESLDDDKIIDLLIKDPLLESDGDEGKEKPEADELISKDDGKVVDMETKDTESKVEDTESKEADTGSKTLDTEVKDTEPKATDTEVKDAELKAADTEAKGADTESKPIDTEVKDTEPKAADTEEKGADIESKTIDTEVKDTEPKATDTEEKDTKLKEADTEEKGADTEKKDTESKEADIKSTDLNNNQVADNKDEIEKSTNPKIKKSSRKKKTKKHTKSDDDIKSSTDDDDDRKSSTDDDDNESKSSTYDDDNESKSSTDDDDDDSRTEKKKKKKSSRSKRKKSKDYEDSDLSIINTKSIAQLHVLLLKVIKRMTYIPPRYSKTKIKNVRTYIHRLDDSTQRLYDMATMFHKSDSLFYIGYAFMTGKKPFQRDDFYGFQFIKEAAELGNVEAIYALAIHLSPKIGPDFNIIEHDVEQLQCFISVLKIAVEFGSAKAAFLLGQLFLLGYIVEKNYVMCLVYMKYAADNKLPSAMLTYANRLRIIANEQLARDDLKKLKKNAIRLLNDLSDYGTRSNKLRKTATRVFITMENPKLAHFVSSVYYNKVIKFENSSKKQRKDAQSKLEKITKNAKVYDLDEEKYYDMLCKTILH